MTIGIIGLNHPGIDEKQNNNEKIKERIPSQNTVMKMVD